MPSKCFRPKIHHKKFTQTHLHTLNKQTNTKKWCWAQLQQLMRLKNWWNCSNRVKLFFFLYDALAFDDIETVLNVISQNFIFCTKLKLNNIKKKYESMKQSNIALRNIKKVIQWLVLILVAQWKAYTVSWKIIKSVSKKQNQATCASCVCWLVLHFFWFCSFASDCACQG